MVDDQDSIRHFVSKALEDDGYTVQSVGSVREGREAFERSLPDLALLDLELNGRVRQIEGKRFVRVALG